MRKVVTTGITALGIAGASFVLTVLNPFSASAQTEQPTTTVPAPADPSTPTTPTPNTPATPERDGNCPDKGEGLGTGETPSTSSSSSAAAFRVRAARS